jgi:hypothetical protein
MSYIDQDSEFFTGVYDTNESCCHCVNDTNKTCLTGANDTNEACLSSITDKNEFASSASSNPKMTRNFTRVIVNDIVTWNDMLCRCRYLWQDSSRNLNNLPLPLTGQPVKNQAENTCDFPIVCIHFKKKSQWNITFSYLCHWYSEATKVSSIALVFHQNWTDDHAIIRERWEMGQWTNFIVKITLSFKLIQKNISKICIKGLEKCSTGP